MLFQWTNTQILTRRVSLVQRRYHHLIKNLLVLDIISLKIAHLALSSNNHSLNNDTIDIRVPVSRYWYILQIILFKPPWYNWNNVESDVKYHNPYNSKALSRNIIYYSIRTVSTNLLVLPILWLLLFYWNYWRGKCDDYKEQVYGYRR